MGMVRYGVDGSVTEWIGSLGRDRFVKSRCCVRRYGAIGLSVLVWNV